MCIRDRHKPTHFPYNRYIVTNMEGQADTPMKAKGIVPVAVKAADITTEKVDYQKIPEVLPGRAGEIVEQMSEEQLVQMATGDPGKDQGNALGSAGISVPGSAAETPLVAAEEPGNVASIALADGCLLYTSRCV